MKKTHAEKIREAVIDLGNATAAEIIDRIEKRYPDEKINPRSYRADIIGCSVNHSSSHHYPSLRTHAFLWFNKETKKYRLARPEEIHQARGTSDLLSTKRIIFEVKNGVVYYLMETPFEGLSKEKAKEYSRWLMEEMGYKDAFIKEVRGYYYVYGNPGITLTQLQNLIQRFTLIENPQELIEKLQWATFREKPQEKSFTVKCSECGNVWSPTSQMNLVECPSCGFKTPNLRENHQE